MPQNLHILIQDEITRGTEIAPIMADLGGRFSRIDLSNWRQQVHELDAEISSSGERVMVFCSLPIAGFIERSCPALARGVLLPRKFLEHFTYSTLLPRDLQLNPTGLYLPWGRIPVMAQELAQLYPQGLFIRPSSPMKPFTGFSLEHHELHDEHHMMTHAARIDPSELCLVAPRLDLSEVEHRVWMVDALPISAASYGWTDGAQGNETPDRVLDAAVHLGQVLEMNEQIYTADFVETDRGVKVVELNAMSTSGWYPGLDAKMLLQALDPMLV